MSWHAPLSLFDRATGRRTTAVARPRRATKSRIDHSSITHLTSAVASTAWGWQEESLRSPALFPVGAIAACPSAPAPIRVHVPASVVRAMAEEAHAVGLSESELWTAAARAWLRGSARDDEPPPPPPAAACAPMRRVQSTWDAIDALLAELRAPERQVASIASRSPAA